MGDSPGVSGFSVEVHGLRAPDYDRKEVWLCKKNIEVNALILEPSEVQDARWFSIDEFKRMIVDGKGIDSGFKIFEMYYDNFYNKHYELVDGKPVLVNNEK